MKTIKIKVPRKKKRVNVPQKPPVVITPKKTYKRKPKHEKKEDSSGDA